jgi:hypothetical protein
MQCNIGELDQKETSRPLRTLVYTLYCTLESVMHVQNYLDPQQCTVYELYSFLPTNTTERYCSDGGVVAVV